MNNYFSSNLKTIREQKGLTQTKLAEILNVNQSNILRWEDGTRTPGIDAVINISNKLNIPLDKLVGEDLRVDNNVILDENHKLDTIIMSKSKELTEDDKQKLISVIDTIFDNKK